MSTSPKMDSSTTVAPTLDTTNLSNTSTKRRLSQSNNATRRSNWDHHVFGKIQEAIAKLSRLSPDDPMRINDATSKKAVDLLAHLESFYRIPPPKLLPEGQEDLSFVWEDQDWKTYLTVSHDSIDAMLVHLRSFERQSEQLSEQGDVDYEQVLRMLSSLRRSETSLA